MCDLNIQWKATYHSVRYSSEIYWIFQAKALGRVLFDQVCKQLHLLEADYFGLEYQELNGTKVSYNMRHIKKKINIYIHTIHSFIILFGIHLYIIFPFLIVSIKYIMLHTQQPSYMQDCTPPTTQLLLFLFYFLYLFSVLAWLGETDNKTSGAVAGRSAS